MRTCSSHTTDCQVRLDSQNFLRISEFPGPSGPPSAKGRPRRAFIRPVTRGIAARGACIRPTRRGQQRASVYTLSGSSVLDARCQDWQRPVAMPADRHGSSYRRYDAVARPALVRASRRSGRAKALGVDLRKYHVKRTMPTGRGRLWACRATWGRVPPGAEPSRYDT